MSSVLPHPASSPGGDDEDGRFEDRALVAADDGDGVNDDAVVGGKEEAGGEGIKPQQELQLRTGSDGGGERGSLAAEDDTDAVVPVKLELRPKSPAVVPKKKKGRPRKSDAAAGRGAASLRRQSSAKAETEAEAVENPAAIRAKIAKDNRSQDDVPSPSPPLLSYDTVAALAELRRKRGEAYRVTFRETGPLGLVFRTVKVDDGADLVDHFWDQAEAVEVNAEVEAVEEGKPRSSQEEKEKGEEEEEEEEEGGGETTAKQSKKLGELEGEGGVSENSSKLKTNGDGDAHPPSMKREPTSPTKDERPKKRNRRRGRYRRRNALSRIVVVDVIFPDRAQPETLAHVKRDDVLVGIDGVPLYLTEKFGLKECEGKIRGLGRPLTLTFVRPAIPNVKSEGRGDPAEEEEGKEAVEGGAVTVEEEQRPLDEKIVKHRRSVIVARMRELHSELDELNGRVGGYDAEATASPAEEQKELERFRADEIPGDIPYHPPTLKQRKDAPALDEACRRVETLLRRRTRAEGKRNRAERGRSSAHDELVYALRDVDAAESGLRNTWKVMYDLLAAYRHVHGHCNVSYNCVVGVDDGIADEGAKLGAWVSKQRTCYKEVRQNPTNPNPKFIIKPYQIDMLDRLGFNWMNLKEQNWADQILRLRNYRGEAGDCNVPAKHRDKKLVNFVTNVRRMWNDLHRGRPNTLTRERIDELENIGFQWRDPRKPKMRSDAILGWDGEMARMAEFVAVHGHSDPGKVYRGKVRGNRAAKELTYFAFWTRKQYALRAEGLQSQLTDARIDQLRGIGFSFEKGDRLEEGDRKPLPNNVADAIIAAAHKGEENRVAESGDDNESAGVQLQDREDGSANEGEIEPRGDYHPMEHQHQPMDQQIYAPQVPRMDDFINC